MVSPRREDIEAAFDAGWKSLQILDVIFLPNRYAGSKGSLLLATDHERLSIASAALWAEFRKPGIREAFGRAAVRLRLPAVSSCGLSAVDAHFLVGMLGQMALHRFTGEVQETVVGLGKMGAPDQEVLPVRLQQEYYVAIEEVEAALDGAVWLGNETIQINGVRMPMSSESGPTFIEVLLNSQGAAKNRKLIDAGISNPTQAYKQLLRWQNGILRPFFAKLPDRGGWTTTVRDGRKNVASH